MTPEDKVWVKLILVLAGFAFIMCFLQTLGTHHSVSFALKDALKSTALGLLVWFTGYFCVFRYTNRL
jgi:hypothetical protein